MSSDSHTSVSTLQPRETDKATIDRAVAHLNEKKQTWADLPIPRKITYLYQLIHRVEDVAERWVIAAAQAKGIPLDSPFVGEEWLSGPWAIIHALKGYIATLWSIEKTGAPPLRAGAARTLDNGQVAVNVFPGTVYERILENGISAEIWMQPGVTIANLKENMASWYRQTSHTGKVALVLGAGNVASIAPLDVLHKLLAEGQVCLLKMNPVNDYLGPFIEEIFAPLIAESFLQTAYGGVAVGEYLCQHPGIEEIHITGSAATYDAIVFGVGTDGAERKRANTPGNPRRITSELGNVSPTIVVPGPWTQADLRYQAEQIVTQKMHNGGFNCIALQVLVLPANWDKTDALIDEIRRVMQATPLRQAYYPGAGKRQAATIAAHPDAEIIDPADEHTVPRTFVHHVDASDPNEFCFRVEAFGGVLTETRLSGDDPAAYLRNAVAFCNDMLWGTLGANVIIHPASIKALGANFEQAIADLKYGCVAINAWTGLGFLLAESSWGAYPGHTPDDIQSGIGVVHNRYLFDRPQKSVVRAPFYPFPRSILRGSMTLFPKPPWFVTHKTAAETSKQLVDFEAHPGVLRLLKVTVTALRG
jgi:acyl-CoA reductase-like NAD-dependent aldehyde dehydrogenase